MTQHASPQARANACRNETAYSPDILPAQHRRSVGSLPRRGTSAGCVLDCPRVAIAVQTSRS
eukprot:2204465-Pleurochrysis_carterae.AAC.3